MNYSNFNNYITYNSWGLFSQIILRFIPYNDLHFQVNVCCYILTDYSSFAMCLYSNYVTYVSNTDTLSSDISNVYI